MAAIKTTSITAQGATSVNVDAASLLCASLPASVVISWRGGSEILTVASCNGNVLQLSNAVDSSYPAGSCLELQATTVTSNATCPASVEQVWALPLGNVEQVYASVYDLPSSGFVVRSYLLPEGMTASIVADKLFLQGENLKRIVSFPVVISLRDENQCERFVITGNITVEDDCYRPPACDVCTYCWSISPQFVVVGTEITTTFTPPEGCDPNAELSLDVFEQDGITPVFVPSTTIPIRLFIKAGTFKYTLVQSDLNRNYVFKPSLVQNTCLASCISCIPEARRTFLPCSYCWSMVPSSVTVGQTITTTVQLPPGCAQNATLGLDVFYADTGLPVIYLGAPLTVQYPNGVSAYTTVATDAGQNLIFRPSATQNVCLETCTPCIPETRRLVDVVPTGACVVNWNITNREFSADSSEQQTYSATGIPAGCSLKLQAMVGGVPLVISGTALEIELVSGGAPITFSQTWPSSYIGQDLYWRPKITQSPCLTCAIQPSRIDFDVASQQQGTCVINYTATPNQLNGSAPGSQTNVPVTVSATGLPPNCSVDFGLFVNGLFSGTQSTLTSASLSTTLSVNTDDNGVNNIYTIRPLPGQLACASACTIQPAQIPINVSSYSPLGLACLTLSSCSSDPGLPSGYFQQVLTLSNLTVGASYLVQQSFDGGVTFSTLLSLPSVALTSYQLPFSENRPCPILFQTAPGIFQRGSSIIRVINSSNQVLQLC